MSKSVLKGIKSLKISNNSWKKLEESASETKKKIKGFRKLIPSMGNLTSSHHRHQHYIENENDYSLELMNKLNEFRQTGILCDLNFNQEESLPAHSAVVSFNPPLFELASTLNQTVAVAIENADEDQVVDEKDKEELEDNGLISHLQVDEITLDGDLSDNKDTESSGVAANNIDVVEEKENKDGEKCSEASEVSTEESEQSNEKCDAGDSVKISPPLATELGIEANSEKKILEGPLGKEDVAMPTAINDPVEVLINFLYTSHIDITKQNVNKIRELAVQCKMDDVWSACDEFEKVLSDETDGISCEKEKEATGAQFRYRYSDPVLPLKMLKHFYNLRNSSQHTDITIVSPSGKIRIDAHSCVLACANNFFQPLILQSDNDKTEFLISEIDEAVLESILDYMYTGRISVSSHTVEDLMKASEKMQITAIIEGSAEFLESMMNVNTSIQHLCLAIDYKQDGLKNAIHKFIATNFNAVTRSADFMTLSVGVLKEILTSNDLELDFPISLGEKSVFNAIKKWIVHDENNRKPYLEEVMSCVRFPLICERELVDHVTTDLMVMANENLCKHITDVIASKPLHVFPQPVEMRGAEYIVTLGGSYPVDDVTSQELGYTAVGYDNHFTLYDPKTGRAHELAVMNETRALHCVVACEQFIFVAGGFDSYSCIVNSVHCFDLSTGTWHDMPNLRIKRACFSLHAVSGYIYAVGGLTPNGYTSTVERLDRRLKRWDLAAPIPDTRYRHAGCVLNGNIVISGGYAKKDSVFSYNPDKNEWSKMPPLNCGRDSHAMLEINNKACVLGGDGIDFSIETFDKGSWTIVTETKISCKQLFLPGAAVIGNNIYLLGGWEQENDVSPEIRCIDTTTWQLKENHMMTIPRGSGASCTIRIPKNYWKTKFSSSKMSSGSN